VRVLIRPPRFSKAFIVFRADMRVAENPEPIRTFVAADSTSLWQISFEFVETGSLTQVGISLQRLYYATKLNRRCARVFVNQVDHVLRDCHLSDIEQSMLPSHAILTFDRLIPRRSVNLRDEGDDFDFWKGWLALCARSLPPATRSDCFPRAWRVPALPFANSVPCLVSEIGVRGTASFAHRFIGFRTRVFVSNEMLSECREFGPRKRLTKFRNDPALALSRDFALTGATTIEFLLNISVETAMRGGQPSTTTPCPTSDSPKVVTRKSWQRCCHVRLSF